MDPQLQRLELAGNCAAPAAASAWINALGAEFGLSPDEIFALDLCITELVSNIVSHGEPDPPDCPIELNAQVACDRIEINIRDAGRPFDPLAAQPPRRARSIEEAIPGGLGIQLAREFSEAPRYQRREGRNVLTFSVRRARVLNSKVGAP
jgi:anti-sigma regulatory factor (Ser/Thr protein kinase)